MRSFKIYGIWSQVNKQASIYTYVHNTVMLVRGSLRLTQISTPGQSSLDPPLNPSQSSLDPPLDPPLNPSQSSLDPPLDPPLDPGQSSLDSGQPPLNFVDGLTGTTVPNPPKVAGRKYHTRSKGKVPPFAKRICKGTNIY